MAYNYSRNLQDTICAISTANGIGATALIRISGEKAISIIGKIFHCFGKQITEFQPRHVYYGKVLYGEEIIDHALLTVYHSPNSYTGEKMAEISCHGSLHIQKRIMEVLIELGCRYALAGEFTMRAFFNNKLDLSQAEAIADLISSTSKSAHELAMKQIKGGFSLKIKSLREQLVNFASLIELELDFSEEDVEFADRKKLSFLISEIKNEVLVLKNSFSLGNAIKNGIPVAIIGKPNVGKSTLLNALLNEEKAIVSEIPGTTRDSIEDVVTFGNKTFRFIDTAGLHSTDDIVENLGIERTYEKINQAQIVLYVVDISSTGVEEIKQALTDFEEHIHNPNKNFIIVANKTDKLSYTPLKFPELVNLETVFISAKRKENINLVIDSVLSSVENMFIQDDVIVSNIRHFESLGRILEACENIEKGFKNYVSTDLIAIDIQEALHYLGEITGEITNDDILGNIFSKFCIGK